jgi:tetratricopeptide (TPR) repeat protein
MEMIKKQVPMIIMLILSTACMRGPEQVVYTPEGFRREVSNRLSHQFGRIGTISVPGGKDVTQVVTAGSLLTPPFELSPRTREGLRHCLKAGVSQQERFNFLYNCLFGNSERFAYIADSTLSADACFQNHQGNCFAMTNLLVGAARYARIDAYYMLVEDIIGNQAQGDTVIHTNHIITAVQIGPERRLVDFIPNSKRYHYVTLLSDVEATGLYYNNLGARLLLKKRDKEAETLLRVAVALYPNSYQIHNNLGVLVLRKGNFLEARQHFLTALKTARFPDLVLGNMMKTFERSGNMKAFELLRKDLDKAKKRNPYFYLSLARREYWRHNYSAALRLCHIAKRISDDVADIYLLEFRIYGKLGLKKKQKKAYKKLLKYEHFDKDALPMPEVVDPLEIPVGSVVKKP